MIETKVVWFKDLNLWTVALQDKNFVSSSFDVVRLGELIIDLSNERKITIIDNKIYNEPTISSKNNTITARKTAFGEEFKVKKRIQILPNDLVISRMHTQNGLFAFSKDEFVSTNTFIPFKIFEKKINPKFLFNILKLVLSKLQKFDSVNRETYTTEEILNLEAPLPPMEIQNKIVADIEEIQKKIKALQKQEKELKDEIERYIYIALGLEKEQKVEQKKAFVVEFKDLNRWDVAYNQNTKINNTTYKYYIEELNNICYINPKINLKNLIKEDKSVSFLSMDSVENDGKTFYPKLKKANENKGFMKFQNNDLLWAKITPCMQNKKSLIVNNLENGYGFGSTEFFVLRPKNLSEVDMKFILEFLRTDYVIEKAKETFKGSAGQQRVPKEFLEDLQIPLPPLNIQKEIVNFVENKKRAIKENQIKIIDLTKEINNTIDKIFIS